MAVKKVSVPAHRAGALSQRRGSISSVSLGIGASRHGKSCADPRADRKGKFQLGQAGKGRLGCSAEVGT